MDWFWGIVLFLAIFPRNGSTAEKPNRKVWAAEAKNQEKKFGFLRWLLDGCDINEKDCKPYDFRPMKYQRFDGFGNNYEFPTRGLVGSPLIHRFTYNYDDLASKPAVHGKPNPFKVSRELFMDTTVVKDSDFVSAKSALVHYFGKFVIEEILNTRKAACPMDFLNLKIPHDHPYHKKHKQKEMPFRRAVFDTKTGTGIRNQRRQMNRVTPWIDASAVYGTSRLWSNTMRMQHGGRLDMNGMLTSDASGRYPEYNWMRLPVNNYPSPINHTYYSQEKQTFPSVRLRVFGHENGNENPAMFAISTLWFRWHNHLALYLKKKHPQWGTEIVFQEARKWLIATLQAVIYEEWYEAAFDEEIPKYKEYVFSQDPQIESMAGAAALKYGHVFTPSVIYMRHHSSERCISQPFTFLGNTTTLSGFRLCNSYWSGQDPFFKPLANPDGILDHVVPDFIFMGLANQLTQPGNNFMAEDLREYLYGPLIFSRRDLAAIDIQRGRDFGLPTWKMARKLFMLEKIDNLVDLKKTISKYSIIHEDVLSAGDKLYRESDVDLYAGGMLESQLGNPGQLFMEMIRLQFSYIRNSDAFYYENANNRRFTKDDIARIRQVKLSDIILSVFDMNYLDIHEDVFRLQKADDVKKIVETDLKSCKGTYDYVKCGRKVLKGKEVVKEEWECAHLLPMNREDCSPLIVHDYFDGNWPSIVFTIVLHFVVLCFVSGFLKYNIAISRQSWERHVPELKGLLKMETRHGVKMITFSAMEFQGPKLGSRTVEILLNTKGRTIELWGPMGGELRVVDLSHFKKLNILMGEDGQHLIIQIPFEYDIVLEFISVTQRDVVVTAVCRFLDACNVGYLCRTMKVSKAMAQTCTWEERQLILKNFFSVVVLLARKIYVPREVVLSPKELRRRQNQVSKISLNHVEFAEVLGLKEDSEFMKNMYDVIDTNKNGYLSLREFFTFFLIFSRGPVKMKMKMFFDMYDSGSTGKLEYQEFKQMLLCLAEISSTTVSSEVLESVIEDLLRLSGMHHKETFNMQDFEYIMKDNKDLLGYTHLDLQGPNVPEDIGGSIAIPVKDRRLSFFDASMMAAARMYRGSFQIKAIERGDCVVFIAQQSPKKSAVYILYLKIRYHWNVICCMLLIIVATGIIFGMTLNDNLLNMDENKKAMYYVVGSSAALSEAAGSAMLFLFTFLLVTNCRNIHTYLRDTFFSNFVPFDSFIYIHKCTAWMSAAFTFLHVGANFYRFAKMSAENPQDVFCLVQYMNLESHLRANFNFWFWGTISGLTGNILIVMMIIIYFFSLKASRRNAYKWFWKTHNIYPLFYFVMFFHVLGDFMHFPNLIFLYVTPVILFMLDHLATLSHHKLPIEVIDVEVLPSNMIKLVVKRPVRFEYQSGQWLRLSCAALNPNEFHPLTIASSPYDSTMNFYIQIVGPWTYNMKQVYVSKKMKNKKYPQVYFEGPFGSLTQNWSKYRVAILIANGEGVFSFISILKDAVFQGNRGMPLLCQKVFFLWSTSSQKHYEWMIDIIRELEENDESRLLTVHICITEASDRYDIRTTMLYLCEEHFHKVRNLSLFTGLRGRTHFGEPNYPSFFGSLRKIYDKVETFGVFFAGDSVGKGHIVKICNELNRKEGGYFDVVSVK